MSSPILLDTNAAIWIASGTPVSSEADAALVEAWATDLAIFVSPVTAWEIGMLVSRGRLSLTLPPIIWFEALCEKPGVKLLRVTPSILIESSFLPGDPPRDPADRAMAASARAGGYRLMTRDGFLLDYAAAGHMQAIAC